MDSVQKKKILIPINQGFSARYILQTCISSELIKKGYELVFLVPDVEAFSHFKNENGYFFERYHLDQCRSFRFKNPVHRFFQKLRYLTLAKRGKIASMELRLDIYKKDYKKRSFNFISEVIFRFTLFCVFFLKRVRILRNLLIVLENRLFVPNIHRDVFEKHQPTLLLTTSMGIFDYDAFVMREARQYSIPVMTLIQSWDNTSGKGLPGALPDRILTWTEIMKKELILLNDISPEVVTVAGIPHFDQYFRDDVARCRDEVFEKIGLDPNRKIIFFGTKSPNSYLWNTEVAKEILEAIQSKKIEGSPQLLVRIHPIHYRVNENGEYVFKKFLDQFSDLSKEYQELFLNGPSMISDKVSFLMSEDEMKLLTSILLSADVCVNSFSTLNLEACIFDVPLINVGYEGEQDSSLLKARYNIMYDQHHTHNARILSTGAVDVAESPSQLIKMINNSLSHPDAKKEQRAQVVKNEIGPNRGVAGKTIAHLISEFIESKS